MDLDDNGSYESNAAAFPIPANLGRPGLYLASEAELLRTRTGVVPSENSITGHELADRERLTIARNFARIEEVLAVRKRSQKRSNDFRLSKDNGRFYIYEDLDPYFRICS